MQADLEQDVFECRGELLALNSRRVGPAEVDDEPGQVIHGDAAM
jgi:hypothetical protein